MNKFSVITIDGPAASGKSTVSRNLAQRLGWHWVSTGAFYRGLAFYAMRQGCSLADESCLVEAASDGGWKVVLTPEKTRVTVDGSDVTSQLDADEVGTAASQISRLSQVRKALLQAQRDCARASHLVAEGRDCGTVVFPQANLKVYLTASTEERAMRRSQQSGDDLQQTLESQKQRDNRDMTRKVAPLEVPEHALVIDTSHMTLTEVVNMIEKTYRERKLGAF